MIFWGGESAWLSIWVWLGLYIYIVACLTYLLKGRRYTHFQYHDEMSYTRSSRDVAPVWPGHGNGSMTQIDLVWKTGAK